MILLPDGLQKNRDNATFSKSDAVSGHRAKASVINLIGERKC